MKAKIAVRDFQVAKVDEAGAVCEQHVGSAQHVVCRLSDRVDLVLVEIPGGCFTMGGPHGELGQRSNEEPLHEVEISPFLMGTYTVTQAQWAAVMGSLPRLPESFLDPGLPVVNASWPDVLLFCHRLTAMTDLAIRLPSEGEWEYACRAGTRSPFHWGPTISANVANFKSERPYGSASPGGSVRTLSPVGAFGVANEFGLYDMHGNVWEWCADVWHDDYRGAPNNGQPWLETGDAGYRVQRGGSWRDIPELCRSAFRVGDIAFNWDNIVGLRVCANAGRTNG